jgi:hypothetical protein
VVPRSGSTVAVLFLVIASAGSPPAARITVDASSPRYPPPDAVALEFMRAGRGSTPIAFDGGSLLVRP